MEKETLSIAAPWGLSHYISLNGFHPLYRALFQACPDWVSISTWSNAKLSKQLKENLDFKSILSNEQLQSTKTIEAYQHAKAREYFSHFGPNNLALTRILPGDIEFHHTAPFPSLTRPFVFHCEAFSPVFFPFTHQGRGILEDQGPLRDHYKKIFESTLCLGIYSHLRETLDALSKFFQSNLIDKKLFPTRIGLIGLNPKNSLPQQLSISSPKFIFINSAHQNPQNFFNRGGHLVLRFWKEIISKKNTLQLTIRCKRPSNEKLIEYGVDLDWLESQEHTSITWLEDYLTESDLNALMNEAHFFLLPSYSLHSASIMTAMSHGAVPIVTDTVGTSRYIEDGTNGIVLSGIYKNNWQHDPNSGVMFDSYSRNSDLESSLVRQLTDRINYLLENPEKYFLLQSKAIESAKIDFCGSSFSHEFWSHVKQQYHTVFSRRITPLSQKNGATSIKSSLATEIDLNRFFSSPPHPTERRCNNGIRILEIGGDFVHCTKSRLMVNHAWSVTGKPNSSSTPLNFFSSTEELEKHYGTLPDFKPYTTPLPAASDWHGKILEINTAPPPLTPHIHQSGDLFSISGWMVASKEQPIPAKEIYITLESTNKLIAYCKAQDTYPLKNHETTEITHTGEESSIGFTAVIQVSNLPIALYKNKSHSARIKVGLARKINEKLEECSGWNIFLHIKKSKQGLL